MQEQHTMESKLWEYIDGLGSPNERSAMLELINTNLEWRRKYEELLHFNDSLQSHIELDAPSLRFTRNVMEEIGRHQIAPSAKSYINKKIIYGIAGFFLALIFGFLVYAIGQIDWNAGSGSQGLPFNLNRINTSRILSNNYVNAFMIINMVLGLMLLDRYLAHQRKNWKKHNG
jgi:hypothetical protein